jgi:aryl-alcohol dehydrogenase-like predicted oxidoreductase
LKLSIGTAQFGLPYGIANKSGQLSINEGGLLLNAAKRFGINTLDTAIAYGVSEQRLGKIGVANWRIISKLPPVPDTKNCPYKKKWIFDEFNQSINRLKVDFLYGLLLHRPEQLLEDGGDEIYSALQQLKADGLVRKIGVSIYEPSELDALYERYKFDIVQSPFNIFDRRLLSSGWLSKLHKHNVEVHVRSIFLQGLLLMKKEDIPSKFDRWSSIFDSWYKFLDDQHLSSLEACLKYTLSFPEISNVIVGLDNITQLYEVVEASRGVISLLPKDFKINDTDLINPASWSRLS